MRRVPTGDPTASPREVFQIFPNARTVWTLPNWHESPPPKLVKLIRRPRLRQPVRQLLMVWARLEGWPSAAVASARLGSLSSRNGPIALTLPRPVLLPVARIV